MTEKVTKLTKTSPNAITDNDILGIVELDDRLEFSVDPLFQAVLSPHVVKNPPPNTNCYGCVSNKHFLC